MFEKVNPSHPDKVADRIAGALVDFAYSKDEKPRIAVEVLIGHGLCTVIAETSVRIPKDEVYGIVYRLAGNMELRYVEVEQDSHLAKNQQGAVRCGDNGIFKGMPVTDEQKHLTSLAREVWQKCKSDGKYIESREDEKTIICQSNMTPVNRRIAKELAQTLEVVINPLGDWTGGTEVDSGATNRKLGSDMGDGVTGGGLHGKDLSKADVSVNIYCHQLAQAAGKPVTAFCAIGDEEVIVRMAGEEARLVPYIYIVEQARKYIHLLGGFERFAEWGLIR